MNIESKTIFYHTLGLAFGKSFPICTQSGDDQQKIIRSTLYFDGDLTTIVSKDFLDLPPKEISDLLAAHWRKLDQVIGFLHRLRSRFMMFALLNWCGGASVFYGNFELTLFNSSLALLLLALFHQASRKIMGFILRIFIGQAVNAPG